MRIWLIDSSAVQNIRIFVLFLLLFPSLQHVNQFESPNEIKMAPYPFLIHVPGIVVQFVSACSCKNKGNLSSNCSASETTFIFN